MEFNEVIQNRFSCKKFRDEQIIDETLNRILSAGRLAPTAKNLQEQKIYVIQNKKILEEIDKETPCRYHAPTVLVIAYDKNNTFTYPGGTRNSGIEDATIVATHLLLASYNEGVDSCYINFFDPDQLKERLKLPENEEILAMIDLGYKEKEFQPLMNHYHRKDLSETVKFLK